jgi:hypothetical protein
MSGKNRIVVIVSAKNSWEWGVEEATGGNGERHDEWAFLKKLVEAASIGSSQGKVVNSTIKAVSFKFRCMVETSNSMHLLR